jgi:hypothetical protein
MDSTENYAEPRLVGRAHPAADQDFQRFARVVFSVSVPSHPTDGELQGLSSTLAGDFIMVRSGLSWRGTYVFPVGDCDAE